MILLFAKNLNTEREGGEEERKKERKGVLQFNSRIFHSKAQKSALVIFNDPSFLTS